MQFNNNPDAIRVLLVDDHKTMLWGLERLIQSGAPEFALAGSTCDAATALHLCATLRPDVVLLDLDLNGTSSLEILPTLLAEGSAQVVILSANRDQATLLKAIKTGARGVVSKEAPAEEVLGAIRKVHAGELWLEQGLMQALLGQFIAPAPRSDPHAQQIASLTAREREIIGLIVHGKGALTKELAARAAISERTLRNHLSTIYQKLQVANRLELYVYATNHDLA